MVQRLRNLHGACTHKNQELGTQSSKIIYHWLMQSMSRIYLSQRKIRLLWSKLGREDPRNHDAALRSSSVVEVVERWRCQGCNRWFPTLPSSTNPSSLKRGGVSAAVRDKWKKEKGVQMPSPTQECVLKPLIVSSKEEQGIGVCLCDSGVQLVNYRKRNLTWLGLSACLLYP